MDALTCLTLAQTGKPPASDAMLWAIFTMVFAVLTLVAAVVVLRKSWLRLTKANRPAQPLEFEQIDKLYEGGQISKEEYNRLRRAALGGLLDAGSPTTAPASQAPPRAEQPANPVGELPASAGQEETERGDEDHRATQQ